MRMNRNLCLDVFCPVLCGVFYLFVNLPVFHASYDQLHELAGAASLYAGNGYVGIDGAPVRSWPPLYSAYVAGWLAVHDAFGMVAFANALLIGLAAASWSYLVREFASRFRPVSRRSTESPGARTWSVSIAMLGAQLTLLEILRIPSAPTLFAFFLPLFLLILLRLAIDGLTAARLIGLLLVSATFANSHNIAPIAIVAFDSACIAALVWHRRWQDAVAIAITAIVAAISWLVVRWVFSLSGSHHFSGLFQSGRSPSQALADLTIRAAGTLMPPWILGAAIMAVVLVLAVRSCSRQRPVERAALLALLFGSLLFYAVLFVVFMSVPINSSIDGRFLLVGFLAFWLLVSIVDRPSSPGYAWLLIMMLCLPLANETARLGKRVARSKIEHVYKHYDYVVDAADTLTFASIVHIDRTRCAKRLCDVHNAIH